ncbi:MAG: carboxypeptidase regulatory-like domain-containing protein [Terriglobales bacterium]
MSVFCAIVFCSNLAAATDLQRLAGKILDPQGAPVARAHLKLLNAAGTLIRETISGEQGNFILEGLSPGEYQLQAEAASFVPVIADVTVVNGRQKQVSLQFRQLVSVRQAISVIASTPSSLAPDPAQRIVFHDQMLDANPGRPGAPISIPGLPIETASGGIKAPQYFAPGVAGDHGEPIAQYFQVGDFLYPNNLPANAHGNGYADPNFLIPPAIEAVTVNGGAFDVRQGNNSVDLAASYVPRQRLTDFIQLTGDYRDADVMAGWSPRNPLTNAWVAIEGSFGNGLLDRLEHRQQYKLNGLRQFALGRHELTVFGIGYYGSSYVPGLIPIDVHVARDTIDNRQLDRTHTFLLVATDNWKLDEQKQLSFSSFFRNYALTLRSNFGDGLIQQSENRNVVGGEISYMQRVRSWFSLLAGVDLRRDGPLNLDLKHVDDQGVFQPVTSNNLTLSFAEPFASLDGAAGKYLRYDLGFRQEQVWMDNRDIINPQNSFNRLALLTLPKGTLTLAPPDGWQLPTVAFIYGEAFHTEDPRIGNGTGQPSLLSPSRAYQLVLFKAISQTQLYVTLRHVSNSQELAKIDPDTGLQQIVGPSLNKVLMVSLQRNFSHGAFDISYSQADARDTQTGQPVPEAPRMIWDAVASENHLPFHLQIRGEFEYVKAKPLGDGFTGVAVREIRGAVLRPFRENRMTVCANFMLASGYTGQTTETLALQTEPSPFERIVGVPLKSYVSVSWTYYFKK